MDGGGSALYPNVTESLSDCKDHDKVHRLHLVWHSLVFLLGLSLNGTALWVFLRYFKFNNKTVIYMVNLAICDLLFTLALPLRIYYYAIDVWPFGDVPCQIAGSLFQVNMYGSCLFLVCINVDRLMALVYPLRSRHLRRPKIAKWACAAVWAVIILCSIPVALAHDTSQCQGANGTVEVRCFESFSRSAWKHEILPLVLCQFCLGFLLPLGAVLYCSARILWALSRAETSAPRKRSKTIRLLLVNVAIFVVCFLPYNVVLVLYTFLKVRPTSASSPRLRADTRWALQITMLLTCANCCLDPLVYYFSTEGFRNTFRAKPAVHSEETREKWMSVNSRKSRKKSRSSTWIKGRRGRPSATPAGDGNQGRNPPMEEMPEREPKRTESAENGSNVGVKEDSI